MFDLDRLSQIEFESVSRRVLEREHYEITNESARSGDVGADFVCRREGKGTVVVGCVAGASRTDFRGRILGLVGARQLYGADAALLLVARPVSPGVLEEYAHPLDVDVWDVEVLRDLIADHKHLFDDLFRDDSALPHPGTLRVAQVTMHNFFGFDAENIVLDDRLTVLVGPNGSGKSATIRALVVLLSWLTRRIANPKANGIKITQDEIRFGGAESTCSIRALVDGKERSWRTVGSRQGRQRLEQSDYADLREAVSGIQAELERLNDRALPVVAYYGVNRADLDIPRRVKSRTSDRLSALENAFKSGGADFRRFFEWFKSREDLENERRAIGEEDYQDQQLDAVRTALSNILPQISDLHVQRSPRRMTLKKRDSEFAVDQLSDGEKSLLALAGDLARRFALANPGADSPLEGSGVVLIDEIDLHLHPAWQRRVTPSLLSTFPNCQFVLTTHSPQVLGSIHDRHIRLVDSFHIREGSPRTFGRDTNSLLTDVFHTSERERDTDEEFSQVESLIDDGEFVKAREKLGELEEEIGADDPTLVRLRAMLSLLVGDNRE